MAQLPARFAVIVDRRCCALGCLGRKRGIDMAKIDQENTVQVGQAFGIAKALSAEIVFENDECGSPEQRWTRMRAWVVSKIAVNVEILESDSA